MVGEGSLFENYLRRSYIERNKRHGKLIPFVNGYVK